MKKPTAMGIIIKITDRHKNTNPIVVADAGSVFPPILMSAPGTKLAKTDVAPKKHINKPGHPHNRTAATVAIIPFVLVSIFSLLSYVEFTAVYKERKPDASFSRIRL
jgi:hypothetical protein